MTAPEPGRSGGLAVRGVSKYFGPVRALEAVSFDLMEGEGLAVFGPNGAGKTTLLKVLAGLTRPDEGEVHFAGEPRARDERSWRGRVGVLSHRTFLYDHLTAEENLLFHAELQGLAEDIGARVSGRLAQVGLDRRAREPVEGFSRGMRQRLALARTLLHDPDLVLLDEPFSGLDVHGAAVLGDVLGALRDGRRTVVLVTHDLARGLQFAGRWAILDRGSLVDEGTTGGLQTADFHERYRSAVEHGR